MLLLLLRLPPLPLLLALHPGPAGGDPLEVGAIEAALGVPAPLSGLAAPAPPSVASSACSSDARRTARRFASSSSRLSTADPRAGPAAAVVASALDAAAPAVASL